MSFGPVDPRASLSEEIAKSRPSLGEFTTRDLVRAYEVATPAKVLIEGGTGIGNGLVYGRIAGFGGTSFKGAYPRFAIRTPGGSTIYAGRFFICALESDEDMGRLAVYESKSVPCPKCGKAPTDVETCCWCCELNEGYQRP